MGGICCLLWLLIGACTLFNCYGTERVSQYETAELIVDTSSGRTIPDTLFGIFFEEINHAGSGGLWAELVSNRGFEAGGLHAPSNINPWSIIGDDSTITVMTELSSCFERNKVALRIDVLCDSCPTGGVGVYNPGFWGMNIEQGKTYKVVFYVRSTGPLNIDVSLTSSDGGQILATSNVIADANEVANWTKMEVMLDATSSNSNSRLQLTTPQKGTLWIDQVSAMPMDTYKGHGFRKDLFEKLAALEPRFLRFPGGCYVEGEWLRNAFRWKETVGPWENRPGHFGDVWMYWTDDGLGYFEFLQLAEDLGAAPVWVINNGISHQDQVDTSVVSAFVHEMLDSIEFARGSALSRWGSLRAAMGHPEPFELRYIAVGNEDCQKSHYRGNYLKYFVAIKKAYPDIQVISNCDGSLTPLDHPADMYDFHIYTLNAYDMFLGNHNFDNTRRSGPKAFVSEYAVRGKDAGTGSLLAALAEAAFLIGIERNSDVIQMASYAPLFVNANDRRWNPDAIVFDSSRVYGTPSYWVQQFFTKSSGATLLNTTLLAGPSASLVSSAVRWKNATDDKNYITIKILNYANNYVILKLSFGVNKHSVQLSGSKKTVLASSNIMDENSFQNPEKVVPASGEFQINTDATYTLLQPYSFTSFDVVQEQAAYISLKEEDSVQIYSF